MLQLFVYQAEDNLLCDKSVLQADNLIPLLYLHFISFHLYPSHVVLTMFHFAALLHM